MKDIKFFVACNKFSIGYFTRFNKSALPKALFIAFVGVVGAHPNIDPNLFPAFTGFAVDNGNGVQYLFPILFTTVACGAISGFHSLVSSGTTSKQLDKEKDAKPIAYGVEKRETLFHYFE